MEQYTGKVRRKSKRPPQVRIFVCQVCGAKSPATKTKGRTVSGHTKHMYCFACQDTTEHIQVDEK